jgi:alcohol dehydrogenase class IV
MLAQVATTTRIVQAADAADLNTIVEYLAPDAESASPVLLVKDSTPIPARDGFIARLAALRTLIILDNVRPDPRAADITAMARIASAHKPCLILAIGGGSTIDSAKGLAALLSNGGDLEDYLGPSATRKIERSDVKLIAIPTTAGTGSEVTKVGVYTAQTGRKYTLANPSLQPTVAVHMPSLIYALPPALTASTGMDALSHALEPLWNRNATALSTRLAIDAATFILRHIERAYESSQTGQSAARLEMLQAATHAGIAFNLTGTAMVHALSFILGEEWHVPHGTACAFTLEDALLYNAPHPAVAPRIGRIAQALGVQTHDPIPWMHETIVSLKKKLQMPFTFPDLNVALAERDIPRLFNRSLDDPKMKNNLVGVDEAAIVKLLRAKL